MPWASLIPVALELYDGYETRKDAKKTRALSEQQAQQEQDLARETLDYYKQRDAQNAALQREANAIAGRVANSQVALMNQQRQISGEYHNRNKTDLAPEKWSS